MATAGRPAAGLALSAVSLAARGAAGATRSAGGPTIESSSVAGNISGHQRLALHHVVLTVRWDCLMTYAPGRPRQSRPAEAESPPRESDPDPRRRGAESGANEQAAPTGLLADRFSAFRYPPSVTRMIVLPGTRRSGANADGT